MIRETGRVWSGAIITPKEGKMFISVSGKWKVPKIALPSFTGSTNDGEIVCSCSTWIGLDGAGSYLHSSLPQIGTIQCVIAQNGQPVAKYFAFCEWWCDGHPGEPTKLDLPIDAEDEVQCTLNVDNLTQVTFEMTNITKRQRMDPIQMPAPNLPLKKGSSAPSIQRLISGATAEWITERPSDPKTEEPYDLANYGEVIFESCSAIAAPAPGNTANQKNQTLDDPAVALRNMVRIRQNRTELISKAELMGPQSVATLYCQ